MRYKAQPICSSSPSAGRLKTRGQISNSYPLQRTSSLSPYRPRFFRPTRCDTFGMRRLCCGTRSALPWRLKFEFSILSTVHFLLQMVSAQVLSSKYFHDAVNWYFVCVGRSADVSSPSFSYRRGTLQVLHSRELRAGDHVARFLRAPGRVQHVFLGAPLGRDRARSETPGTRQVRPVSGWRLTVRPPVFVEYPGREF
jgi:hypothetical protein